MVTSRDLLPPKPSARSRRFVADGLPGDRPAQCLHLRQSWGVVELAPGGLDVVQHRQRLRLFAIRGLYLAEGERLLEIIVNGR